MIEKNYEPAAVESRIYADWLKADAFAAGAGAAEGAETFTIVIPPPNVTGSLHIGHALRPRGETPPPCSMYGLSKR